MAVMAVIAVVVMVVAVMVTGVAPTYGSTLSHGCDGGGAGVARHAPWAIRGQS